MAFYHILGGKEEKTLKGGEIREEDPRINEKRLTNRTFVTTFRRSGDAIRHEIVVCQEHSLGERKKLKGFSLIDLFDCKIKILTNAGISV